MRRIAYALLAFVMSGGTPFAQIIENEWDNSGRTYCSHFPTFQDARDYCLAEYGTTLWCGGLDRDRDSLPCECNPGGPDEHEQACISMREEGEQ
jgi:hypothetical protein